MSEPALPLTIYYGTRWFVLCAPDFVLERSKQPYRRLSATLLIACDAPFELQTAGRPALYLHACLIAPGVARERLVAVGSHIRIFDLPIETAYYAPLAKVLGNAAWLPLDIARFSALMPQLRAAGSGALSDQQLPQLLADVVFAASGAPPTMRQIDPRIARVVDTLNQDSRIETTALAQCAQLSVSGFRQLFRKELGCTLRQYRRWASVWRAVWLWQRGVTWTEIALDCGFFDLSHLDHAFVEVFGLNPSTVVDPRTVLLRRCPD